MSGRQKLFALFASVLLLGAGCFHSTQAATDFSLAGDLPVAVKDYPDLINENNKEYVPGGVNVVARSVPMRVHYPTTPGKYPLLIVSHGANGTWDSLVGQAKALASHGYVAVCVEHTGSNAATTATSGKSPAEMVAFMVKNSKENMSRPQDLSFAIDTALEWNKSDPVLKGMIDVENIGVIGHSLGSYDVMVVAGIVPTTVWFEPSINDGTNMGPDLYDARIKACVALSPQGVNNKYFSEESFKRLRTVYMGMSGTKDAGAEGLTAESRRDGFNYLPTNNGLNKFVWVVPAAHLDFCDEGQAPDVLAKRAPQRPSVQPIVKAATVMFFNQHLKGRPEDAAQLSSEGLARYLDSVATGVEVSSR